MQPQAEQQNQQQNPIPTAPLPQAPTSIPVPPAPQPMPPSNPPITPTNIPQATAVPNSTFIDKLPGWLFFYGFASIFLINFINAVVDPKSFTVLLTSNVLVPSFAPSAKLLVDVAAVNDLAVGVLILTKWNKKWVYAWAGTWLLIVAITKAGHFLAM